MILPIQSIYSAPVGEHYTLRGTITVIEPKRICDKEGDKEGLIRTKIRIRDETGSIDIVIFHATTPPNFFLEEEVQIYGKLQQVAPKPPYTKPYTSLLVKITDLIHAKDAPEEPKVSLPPIGIKSSNPDLLMETAPPFNDEHYLPTPRIGSLLVELYALLGKYVKEMEKK